MQAFPCFDQGILGKVLRQVLVAAKPGCLPEEYLLVLGNVIAKSRSLASLRTGKQVLICQSFVWHQSDIHPIMNPTVEAKGSRDSAQNLLW